MPEMQESVLEHAPTKAQEEVTLLGPPETRSPEVWELLRQQVLAITAYPHIAPCNDNRDKLSLE